MVTQTPVEPPSGGPGTSGTSPKRGRLGTWLIVLVLAVAAVLGWLWLKRSRGAETAGAPGGGRSGMMTNAVPVIAGTVEKKDVPIFLEGLGTVQAFNTVTVRSRVDGQVVRIAFVEGQEVHAGDLLAQIDPAPFQAQLDQSMAKKAQDEAELSA